MTRSGSGGGTEPHQIDVQTHVRAAEPAMAGRFCVRVSVFITGDDHGRAAFEAVMDSARQTGTGRAELLATADGRGIYERAGFAETEFEAMRVRL